MTWPGFALAVVVGLARADDSTTVRSDSAEHWTGTVVWQPESQRYDKLDNDIAWGLRTTDACRSRGWCRFNLSAIPDTVRILGATLSFLVSYLHDTLQSQTDVRHLASDPVSAGAEELYEEAGSGALLGSGNRAMGWNSIVLDSAGRSAVQQGLARDWVAVAWDYPYTWDAYTLAFGWQSRNRPGLTLTYVLSGISEPDVPRPRQFGLTIEPNPVTTAATIRYALPEAGIVGLKLYDPCGRLVRVLAEGRRAAGVHAAALQPERLRPGAYVLRLDAGSRHLVRRLAKE
jgi:hypothetical protein